MRLIGEDHFINQRNAACRKRRVAVAGPMAIYEYGCTCFSKIHA
jgi:hypothetical protein